MATKSKTRTPVKRKAAAKVSAPKKKAEAEKDPAKTYNQYMKFEGKQYAEPEKRPEGSGAPVGTDITGISSRISM